MLNPTPGFILQFPFFFYNEAVEGTILQLALAVSIISFISAMTDVGSCAVNSEVPATMTFDPVGTKQSSKIFFPVTPGWRREGGGKKNERTSLSATRYTLS
jgi:hypothetical protein